MPDKKVFLPLAAALGLVVVLWLAFHDRSSDPVPGPASAHVKSAGSDNPRPFDS